MRSTKSGETAIELRGYDRIWLLDAGHRFEIIEVKPGHRIEDIDTRAWGTGFENWTYATHVEARRYSKADDADFTGWIVERGNTNSDLIPNKADAVREARHMLTTVKSWYWEGK